MEAATLVELGHVLVFRMQRYARHAEVAGDRQRALEGIYEKMFSETSPLIPGIHGKAPEIDGGLLVRRLPPMPLAFNLGGVDGIKADDKFRVWAG